MALSLDGTTGISASGNITGGNVIASGTLIAGTFSPASVSASGNITGSYIIGNGSQLTGLPAGYTNSNLATLGSNVISTTGTITGGNITGANILTGGLISAAGNVTGAYLFGNASTVTGLSASKIFNGTSEANIGASGGNANITIAGTSNVFVVSSTGTFVTGLESVTGNVQGGNLRTAGLVSATGSITGASVVGGVMTGTSISVTGAVSGASTSVSGTVTGASVVGGVITGSSVSVTGTINGTTVTGTSLTVTTGNITGGNLILSGAITDSGQLDISTTASNGNIVLTPNGTGNVNTGANISVTGRVAAASVVGGVITGSSVSVTGAQTAASTVGGVITGSSVSVTGAVTSASVVGGVMSGSSLTVTTGTLTGGNIVNGNANGVGNIGSSTTYFNTVFAKATSAQYADLAEMYLADSEYTPGTVLDFGGEQEVTVATQSHSTQVAGIVSTNPSYLMNSTLTCTNAVQVALVGRVPCHVVGTIAKGDRLVSSSIPGIATRLDMSQYQPGCIIGKALETYDSETVGTIEVAVGRI